MTKTATRTKLGYLATRTRMVVPGDDREREVLVVHDVPIFTAHKRGDRVLDDKWMAAAVKTAKAEQRGGYLPPLHLRHHEPTTEMNDSVRAAGVFKITGARPYTYEGKRRLAIFADLIVTNRWAQDEVLDMLYPYVSVEIFRPDEEPRINGLSMLDHEAPWFRFPLVAVRQVETRESDAVVPGLEGVSGDTFRDGDFTRARDGRQSLVACYGRDRGSLALLYRLGAAVDEEDEKDLEELETEEVADAGAGEGEGDEAASLPGHEDEDDQENAEDDDSMSIAELVKKIEAGELMQKDMDAILEAIQKQGDGDEPGDDPALAPAPGMEIMKDEGAKQLFSAMQKLVKDQRKVMAKQQAQIDAIELRDKQRDVKAQRTTDVAWALKKLEGVPLGADLKKKLAKRHETYGSDGFRAYVEDLAASTGAIPKDDTGGDLNFREAPKVAMLFSDQGTKAVEDASVLSAEFDYLTKQGVGLSHPRETYVLINMKELGYDPEPVQAKLYKDNPKK